MKNNDFYPKTVVAIAGSAEAEKDRFCRACAKYLGKERVKTVNFMDNVKKAAKLLGWNGRNSEDAEDVFCALRNLSGVHYDAPFSFLKNEYYEFLRNDKQRILFLYVHNLTETERSVRKFGATPLRICRENDSQNLINAYPCDTVISNNGSMEELEVSTIEFLMNLARKNAGCEQFAG